NPSNPSTVTGQAMLTGTVGRTAYDQRLLSTTMYFGCDPDATYCAWTPYPGDKLIDEAFKGIQVGDDPAMVEHILCCNGHHWSVIWYGSAQDTTYELMLSVDVANEISASVLGEENRSAAESVAGIASQLVPLR